MKDNYYFSMIPWVLSAVVTLLAFLVWGQGLSWQFHGATTEEIFPFFGILAFSLMWVHYVTDFLERFLNLSPATSYLPTSRYIVLAALLLHPGLLAWASWKEGYGLPPGSWLKAVDPNVGFWVTLGIIAWLGFMLFEFYRWYREHAWFKWVALLTDLAMIAIVFHALALGGEVQNGWFHWVWFFYAVTLFISIGYYYYRVYGKRK